MPILYPYDATPWETGDIITKTRLNSIEGRINSNTEIQIVAESDTGVVELTATSADYEALIDYLSEHDPAYQSRMIILDSGEVSAVGYFIGFIEQTPAYVSYSVADHVMSANLTGVVFDAEDNQIKISSII